jgi:hypothetical protein
LSNEDSQQSQRLDGEFWLFEVVFCGSSYSSGAVRLAVVLRAEAGVTANDRQVRD